MPHFTLESRFIFNKQVITGSSGTRYPPSGLSAPLIKKRAAWKKHSCR
jgi:hypothetical protein